MKELWGNSDVYDTLTLDKSERGYLENHGWWDSCMLAKFLKNYPMDEWNPLGLAIHHEDPIKFVLDHRFYWGDSFFPKIIEFLTAKPENFKHPGVMNLLSDMIYEKLDQIRYSESLIKMELCIGGISKALEIPRLRTRAIELLVYVGSTYDDDFYDFSEDEELPVYRRSLARKALRKSIEEPEVKAILQEMMEREPAVDLKIELLKMLRPDYFLDEFEEKIIEISFLYL